MSPWILKILYILLDSFFSRVCDQRDSVRDRSSFKKIFFSLYPFMLDQTNRLIHHHYQWMDQAVYSQCVLLTFISKAGRCQVPIYHDAAMVIQLYNNGGAVRFEWWPVNELHHDTTLKPSNILGSPLEDITRFLELLNNSLVQHCIEYSRQVIVQHFHMLSTRLHTPIS